jgi:hypothetical protein
MAPRIATTSAIITGADHLFSILPFYAASLIVAVHKTPPLTTAFSWMITGIEEADRAPVLLRD